MAAGQVRGGLSPVDVTTRSAGFLIETSFVFLLDRFSIGDSDLAAISFFPGQLMASLINVDSKVNTCRRE